MSKKNLGNYFFILLIITIVIFLKYSTDKKDKILASTNHQTNLIKAKLNDLNIMLVDLDGTKEKLIHKKDEIIVINQWATTCSPCKIEIPGLNKLVEKYKSNPRIRFIAVNKQIPSTIIEFLEKEDFRFAQKVIAKESVDTFNTPIPRHIICNQNGNIVYDRYGGYANKYKEIDNIISSLYESPESYLHFN